MATLKISELSVGDWVKCAQRNGRIQRIAMNEGETVEVMIEAAYGRLYMYKRVYEIDPILITPEILEKNGFERSTSQFIVYHTDKVWISYDEPSETWSVTVYINDVTSNLHANILHIHQLQHALRLAGVDKEINL